MHPQHFFDQQQNKRLPEINVRDYLNGIHDIQDKTPCIALTLFKHKDGCVKK